MISDILIFVDVYYLLWFPDTPSDDIDKVCSIYAISLFLSENRLGIRNMLWDKVGLHQHLQPFFNSNLYPFWCGKSCQSSNHHWLRFVATKKLKVHPPSLCYLCLCKFFFYPNRSRLFFSWPAAAFWHLQKGGDGAMEVLTFSDPIKFKVSVFWP